MKNRTIFEFQNNQDILDNQALQHLDKGLEMTKEIFKEYREAHLFLDTQDIPDHMNLLDESDIPLSLMDRIILYKKQY